MEPAWNSVGDRVYVRDETFEYIPARILEIDEKRESALVQIQLPETWKSTTCYAETSSSQETNGERWVKLSNYPKHKLPLRSDQIVGDMADLPHLHEASILYQVKERHGLKKPYTRVGDIVVAVNPCQWIEELYTPENQRAYALNLVWHVAPESEASSSEEKKDDKEAVHTGEGNSSTAFGGAYDRLGYEPHVYEVSALAYRGLALERKDQTLLVSGESGAGKTETVKIVLKHLARMPEWRPDCDGYLSDLSHRLVEQILEGLPIFEAFGNAETRRNHNSSRFGKVTRLHFALDQENHVCLLHGTRSDTYLLETSRVVSHVSLERNFHIFYQLLAAPHETKKLLGEEWKNTCANDFKYLVTSAAATPGICDAILWQETSRALQFFGWEDTRLETLVQALGIVLRLGNIRFDEEEEGRASIRFQEDLELLSRVIGIPVEVIRQAMTRRMIKTAQEEIDVPLTAEQAKEACDALAKTIYSRLFSSVVSHINDQTCVSGGEDEYHTISLVDIFGFESFERNGFEQLCVNYTSEKLQNKYVFDNVKRFTEEFEAEQIGIFDYSAFDNSATLALFESSSGLICSLDEEGLLPNGNNEAFVYKIKSKESNSSLLIVDDLQEKTEFGVYHYAGPAIYDARNFIERNSNKIPQDLIALATRSSNALVSSELQRLLEENAFSDPAKKKKKSSILEKFRVQLRSLLMTMQGSQVRYIRCIKPNETLEALRCDHSKTMSQLRCAGLVAAIELQKETFPNKLSFDVVDERFSCLIPLLQMQSIRDMPLHDRVCFMMSLLFADMMEEYRGRDFEMPFACGKTKVFFRAGSLELIEALRYDFFLSNATRIQQWFRKEKQAQTYEKVKSCTIRLQSAFRGVLCRIKFQKQKKGFIILQANQRRKQVRKAFVQQTESVVVLQRWGRSLFANQTGAAVRIQACNRAWQARIIFLTQRFSAIILQRWIRYRQARRRYTLMKESALLLAATGRTLIARSHYLRFRRAIVAIQALARTRLVQRELYLQREAASTISRWFLDSHYPASVQAAYCGRCGAPSNAKGNRGRPLSVTNKVIEELRERETQYLAALEKQNEKETAYLQKINHLREWGCEHKQKLQELGAKHAAYRQQIQKLKEQRDTLSHEKDGFEDNNTSELSRKEEFQEKEQAYQQQIKYLRSKEAIFRQEIEELRGEIMQITSEAELHNQEVEAEYDERLLDYENEVLQMRQAIAQLETEKLSMKKNMATAQKNHMATVRLLQEGMRETADSHKEYLGKITSFLQSSNEARKSETAKFAKELNEIQHSSDGRIHELEREVCRLRTELANNDTSRAAIPADSLSKEVHRLARELESTFSTQHILSVLEQASVREKRAASLETNISTKCRRALYHLENIAAQALDENTATRDVGRNDIDTEAVGLQNQLVKAYEEIERLHAELLIAQTARSRRRKRSIKKYFRG